MKTKSKSSHQNRPSKKQKFAKDTIETSSESSEPEEDDMTATLLADNAASQLGQHRAFSKVRATKRLIVVLENACLESVKIGSSYELLNCDKHKQQIIKVCLCLYAGN